MSYTITCRQSARNRPSRQLKRPDEARRLLLASDSCRQLGGTITGGEPSAGPSFVSATATEKYKAVTVRKGETVELPFGPPYTPTVTAMALGIPKGQAEQTYLQMSLVGVRRREGART